jgi:hypothetical protein
MGNILNAVEVPTTANTTIATYKDRVIITIDVEKNKHCTLKCSNCNKNNSNCSKNNSSNN